MGHLNLIQSHLWSLYSQIIPHNCILNRCSGPDWCIGDDGCGCALVWLSKIHSFESFWTFTPLSEFWVRKTLWWRLPTREMRFLVSPCLEKLILFIHVIMDKLKSCFSRQGETRITHFSGRKPSSQCFSDPEYTLVLRTKLHQTGRNVGYLQYFKEERRDL